ADSWTTSVHCVLQHVLTLLCDFTWPYRFVAILLLYPVAFHFVIIPQQLTMEYLVVRKCYGWTYCTCSNPITIPRLNFTELLRATHSFTNVCRSNLHARCLILYTCGHGGDWNT
ncbi:unnamed protein product, partial [Staurois parvus]